MVDSIIPITNQEQSEFNRLLSEAVERLRHQREALRQRGMDVPPGTIKNMETVMVDMEAIAPSIIEQHNELERLRTLSETPAIVNSSLDLDVVLGSVMETVLELTGAERGYIVLHNTQTDALDVRIARGMNQHDNSEDVVFSRSVVQSVFDNGEAIVSTNAQLDERFAQKNSIVGYNLRSILCVPLVIKGNVEGVIYADHAMHEAVFGEKELKLLQAIANQSALAIENAKLFEQARFALHEITNIKTLLDSILGSIVSGVITTDAQNMITTYNNGAETILGIPQTQTQGRSFPEATPGIYEAVETRLSNVYNAEEAVTFEQAVTPPNNEAIQHLNFKLSPLKNANNQTQGVALVLDDLTEIKRRDAMLEAVRRYLPPAMVENIQSIEGIGLGGERRLVTVLFADMRPIETFDETLKAGELMELLNVYLTVGTEAIHRRAGLIDKYMGSEIMALFNTQLNPSYHHAWDAVLTSLEMMEQFHTFYKQQGEATDRPYYRIGIHTGVATMGNVGGVKRREFTAIGDTVNLAKRLEENAQIGELIISSSTYQACAAALDTFNQNHPGALEIIPRGEMKVKGKSIAAEVYQIIYHFDKT